MQAARVRLPSTLDTSLFHEAELAALRLDGDGYPLGRSLVPLDVPVDAAVRAAALSPAVARYGLVVDSWAAAWVHGARVALPDPLTLAVDVRDGVRTRTVRPAPREARFRPGDVTLLGGVRVVSVFRAAFDLTRLADHFDGEVVEVVRGLLRIAGLDAPSAAAAAVATSPCPHKHRAIDRLLAIRGLQPVDTR